MKEYWNALRYGNRKTKLFLWTVILLSAGVVGCIFFAALAGSLISGIIALFMGVLDIIVMQSVSLKDIERKNPPVKKERKQESGKTAGAAAKEEPGPASSDGGGKKRRGEEEETTVGEAYSKERIEKLFSAHKVKKNPRPVMIDSSVQYHIKQCPAYLWKEKTNLHLLCLGEKRADEYTVPLSQIKEIILKKGAPCREGQEYKEVKASSFLNSLFGPFLPSYYEKKIQNRYVVCKNLYVIFPDIAFTNTSAAALLEVLQVGVHAEDEVLRSDRFDFYFKELYKYNLLWKDGAVTLEEYKKQTQRIVKALSEAVTDKEALKKELDQMAAFRLITEEYAEYYRK